MWEMRDRESETDRQIEKEGGERERQREGEVNERAGFINLNRGEKIDF